MENHRTAIIKGFASALTGLTYNNKSVPVYTGSPLKAPTKPYIQLGSLNTNEEGCKDMFGHACSYDVQIIDNSNKNFVSPKACEEITDLVLAAIKPSFLSVVTLADPFEMTNLTLSNSFQDSGIFETDRYYRNILQFSFDVHEVLQAVWIMAEGVWNNSGVWVDTEVWID